MMDVTEHHMLGFLCLVTLRMFLLVSFVTVLYPTCDPPHSMIECRLQYCLYSSFQVACFYDLIIYRHAKISAVKLYMGPLQLYCCTDEENRKFKFEKQNSSVSIK